MIFFIIFLFFPLFSIQSEENLTSLSLQAEALEEAQDYAAASQMYEKLLTLSLPNWQKERLLYNLGTIRLAQQKPMEALAFFQRINPIELSLPRFGRNLFLNKGIAYLQYAQSVALDPTPSFTQQIIFIKESLKAFNEAQQLECQMQKKEEASAICESSFLLNQWTETARLQLNQILQTKRQAWMENATLESLVSLLYKSMQGWLDHFKQYQDSSTSLFSYFQHQAESLIPLWKALQQKQFSIDQKTAFDKATASYLSALQNLNEENRSSAVKEWEQSIKEIQPLLFQKDQAIQDTRLSYDILFLQEALAIPSLKDLIKQVENLKVGREQANLLEQALSSLKISLEALQAQYYEQAQFFFIASYSQFGALFHSQTSSPDAILQQALDKANEMLQLSLLAEAMPKDQATQVHAILKNQQGNILKQALPFISAVLKEEDERFHQTKDLNARCQQTPWDQVIPLYDRGFRSSQSIDKQLQQAEFNFPIIIASQVQTIKEWEQALNLILHPPQQGGGGATQQKWADTLRQIQEMYLEDQSQPEQTTKELHSW